MKHTKNILKSLLIMIVAISLFTVSCSKDEGGSKPTSPQTVVVDAATITTKLLSIFTSAVDDTDSNIFEVNSLKPASGAVTVGAVKGKNMTDIKKSLSISISDVASKNASVIKLTSDVDKLSDSVKVLTLTMETANANVNFAPNVTDNKIYTYNTDTGKATLKVTIDTK
ncbi:hypothetical protein [uncultured Brachyspira sp.]|uniref:hypothetical protein n=1 Tax=uncultured Brachyspira sp. TaxID=221953 RepID=UPI002596224F|nr:hypothetical protein [uncultured Brachyspira sp.]